ncbi:hypothetical protein KWH75_14845 [Morganella morganii]|uniref:hypothetical protein n=1 Tax=Morganella morganii TaxID=582 RepID=UPI0021D32C26|nr:hypothetical protein [Morganella morganii]MCU6238341.1 hypothetical protein [Morganella morganii]
MKKIGDITATADQNGEFTNGNVAAGVPPTLLESGWFNSVQREIINVLVAAGVPQNKDKDDQLSEAIKKLAKAAAPDVSDATTDKKGIVQLDSTISDSDTKVPPSKLIKAALADKPSTASMTLELNKKVNKSDVSDQLGNDKSKVPSLDLLTTELGKKAPAGNYAVKGESYLKTESDGRYQPKGSYQAAGYSYSKTESDGRYQPKGAESSELVIGINQKWTNVSSQRSPGVNYTNGLKKPLMINIYSEMSGNNAPWIKLYVAGALVAHSHVRYDQNLKAAFVTAIVPPGTTYSYQKDGTTVVVMELR